MFLRGAGSPTSGGIRLHRPPLTFLAATFALAVVTASHDPVGRCDSGGLPSLGIVEVGAGSAESTFYVDDRNVLGNDVWVYLESNGVWTGADPGHDLQRGSACEPMFETCRPEICTDLSDVGPDLLLR